jgi:phage-related protein
MFHLVIAEYPSISRLNEDYESIQVEGRSGSLIINKGTYGDRSITMKLRLVDVEYMWNRMDDIEDWLQNVTDNRMYFERRDRCWRVKKVRIGDIKKEMGMYGEFDVTFLCEPFMEDIAPKIIYFNSMAYDTGNTKVFQNVGSFKAEPTIIIYRPTTNMQLTINDETTTFNDISTVEKIIIDSKLMTCVDENGRSLMNKMFGDFPLLEVGENAISYVGTCKDISVSFTNLYR